MCIWSLAFWIWLRGMTKPIKNNQQYEDALKKAYELMQLELPEGSIDSHELEVLSIFLH